MFGLLGGLLGGAMRGRMGHGGGILGGLRKSGGGGGGEHMSGYAARAPQSEPFEPEPQEQSGQQHAERQQEAPPQQPPEQSPVTKMAPTLQSGASVAQQRQESRSPISGLLGDTKPAAPPRQAEQDVPPAPPSISNKTNSLSPVAPQQEEQLGFIPRMHQTDVLHNRLFDSGSERVKMEYQEGMPAREVDTSDSEWTPPMGLSYRQPTTVAGSVPAPRYRST